MSHFNVAVIMPLRANFDGERRDTVPSDAERVTTHLLAKYDENGEATDGTWGADGTRWDWWVIGGRWDGAIRGLDWVPYKEPCDLCNGTGERPGGLVEFGQAWYDGNNGCNGCSGAGMRDVWPTDEKYQSVGTNVCRVVEMPDDYRPYAFVTPDGVWHEKARMGWFAADMPNEDDKTPEEMEAPYKNDWAKARKAHAKSLVVGVDCHV